MKLLKYLANLGYGSRREVRAMFDDGRVMHEDGGRLRGEDAFTHDVVRVDGEPLDAPPGAVVMLHKPVGFVCSTKDTSRLVYELLPSRFPLRSPVIAPIGRLDRETSGLLLLTDDGQLNHRITSPRSHLSKTYQVALANDLRGDEAEIFASGTLMLDGETSPLEPLVLETIDERHARVTVIEGRYHQVRRMFAAVGNHTMALHRASIGGLTLGALLPGEWRALAAADIEQLFDDAQPRVQE